MISGGSWSAYWYNGIIVSSEIARGLDIYELVPSGLITENEIAAAKTVKVDYWNTQDQQRFVWPPSFALARAYLDQLARSNGLAADMIATRADGAGRRGEEAELGTKAALTELASHLRRRCGRSRRSGEGALARDGRYGSDARGQLAALTRLTSASAWARSSNRVCPMRAFVPARQAWRRASRRMISLRSDRGAATLHRNFASTHNRGL